MKVPKYTDAHKYKHYKPWGTDLRATFARIRRQLRKATK